MANGYKAPPRDAFGQISKRFEDLSKRTSELEIPSGTSLAELVNQVQIALANITSTVQNAISINSYTKGEIDSRIANPGNVAATGSMSVAGTLYTGSAITTPSTIRGDGGIYSNDARNFVVVSNYAASWIDINGHFGISPSSRRFKYDIQPWEIDIDQLLDVEVVQFRYKPQDYDQPTIDEFGQLLYTVQEEPALQVGMIAEQLVEQGFAAWTYDDADGQVLGINYDRVVTGLLLLAQRQQKQLDELLEWKHSLE